MVARHLPGYNYCGPGTEDFSAEPVNALDRACRTHDLAYRASARRIDRVRADAALLFKARILQLRYPLAAGVVATAMSTAPGLWYRG